MKWGGICNVKEGASINESVHVTFLESLILKNKVRKEMIKLKKRLLS